MTRPRSSFDSYTDPSPSHQHQHQHRSLSPLHLNHSSKHTRRQDASRLLDPSYSSSAQTSTAVYIDHHGDAHDPDYRYFPAVTPLHKQKKNTAFWDDAIAVDDEEEEDQQDMGFFDRRYGGASTHRRSSWGSGQQATRDARGRRRHSGSFGTSTSSASPTSGRSMSLFSGYHYESPPTSFEEESAFAGEEFLVQKEKRGILAAPKHLKRKRCKHTTSSVSSTSPLDADEPISPVSLTATSSLPHSTFSHRHYAHHEPAPTSSTTTTTTQPASASAPVSAVPASGDWTPTCGQSLKRQWQAIALRFRFGVFRAQRRVKRRVHSLL